MLCMCVCVCTLAHLRIHGSKNLDQWAAQQQSSAAQRRSAFLYTLLSNAAFTHTHTCIRLRCLQNRLQPQCNPKKKQRCQRHRLQPRPRRSALLSLSSTLILSLPHSLALFILCIAYLEARSADCCCCQAATAAAVYSSVALSHTLSRSL